MNASFVRKVVYGSMIVLLWFPLSFIGQPPSVNREGERSGGLLSNMRDENALSQAQLGQIDPTSESMRLATLGLRGVAVNVLWTMANHYKKVEDFESFAATVNQITLLQPNFVTVWEFQAHNESYNVSVEYDHYKMRYAWVKKGIDLLIRGTQYNSKDTRLLNYLSWFFGQKIGRSDEQRQFRELFRNDRDYHAQLANHMDMEDPEIMGAMMLAPSESAAGSSPEERVSVTRPDNWLVGRKWQLRAVNLVESKKGVAIRGKSPVLFYADAPMLRINYCKAIEDEGVLYGNVPTTAWQIAGNDWREYGGRPIPTSWGHNIYLNDQERLEARRKEIQDRLEKLAPGARQRLIDEKMAKLKPEQREALETPFEKRTEQQLVLAMEAEDATYVSPEEVATQAPSEKRTEAIKLAREHSEVNDMISKIERYRSVVNFAYWRMRCEIEQTDTALLARQNIHRAEQAFAEAELEQAKELYEKSWDLWAQIYEKYPEMMDDVEAEEIVEAIDRYRTVLSQLELRQLPEDFPLRKLLEVQGKAGMLAARGSSANSDNSAEQKEPQGTPDDKPQEGDADKKEPASDKPADEPAVDAADTPKTDATDDKSESAPADAAKDDQPASEPADNNPGGDDEAKEPPADEAALSPETAGATA